MISSLKSEGHFGKQDFVYVGADNIYPCSDGERVFPCLWLISPSLLRWRLSRLALLMLPSIVLGADSINPSITPAREIALCPA
jgi:hypothetical protein